MVTSVATETATGTETETTITESRTLPPAPIAQPVEFEKDSQLKLRVDSNHAKIEEYELMTKVSFRIKNSS